MYDTDTDIKAHTCNSQYELTSGRLAVLA